jgi:hypothetical protein
MRQASAESQPWGPLPGAKWEKSRLRSAPTAVLASVRQGTRKRVPTAVPPHLQDGMNYPTNQLKSPRGYNSAPSPVPAAGPRLFLPARHPAGEARPVPSRPPPVRTPELLALYGFAADAWPNRFQDSWSAWEGEYRGHCNAS